MNRDAFEQEDFDALAAEFVLGLTPLEDQAEVRMRMTRDPAFAAAVSNWQERLVRLTDDIKPEKPPRRTKADLKLRLFGRGGSPGGGQLWVWQGLSFVALALAVYFSVSDLRLSPVTPPPLFAAKLESAPDELRILAVYDPLRGEVAARVVEGSARSGRALELWAFLPSGAPLSLGVLPKGAPVRFRMPEEAASDLQGLTLVITDEPLGGSLSGAPSGQTIATAQVQKL